MKKHYATMANGDRVVLFETDDGNFPCPVCGEILDEPPWCPNDGEVGEKHPVPSASYGICPTCDTQYGYDDGVYQTSTPGWALERWKRRRVAWLDQLGWPEWALEQLRSNLEIDTEQLKREAGRHET